MKSRLSPLSLLLGLALAASLPAAPASAARIKDLGHVEGVRPNQLVGYGLVVGLDRTGDTQRSAFTLQSLTAMLSRLGIRIDPKELLLRNVAAVMVTAKLPPFVRPGSPLDVQVSAIGDARSLVGGTLVLTPMNGVDGKTYAMAQGALQVGGHEVRGRSGSRLQKNHLNVGRIPGGALVERGVPVVMAEGGVLRIELHRPDFTTASLVAAAVNQKAQDLAGDPAAVLARAADAGVVEVTVPEASRPDLAAFVAKVEVLSVTPDASARVVVNGRTGTVVLGEDVRIGTVAIAHGPLTLEVEETPAVSQPGPLSGGTTAVVPASRVTATEPKDDLVVVKEGATIQNVVQALNALGASPRDLVDILQAIDAAGALHGTLEVL